MARSLVYLIILLFACQSPPAEDAAVEQGESLGVLNYEFNISEPAKADFDKGLLLLHSFEYEDAREAFKSAVEADDAEVMAHWGEAMTYYKALWGLQDVEAGQEIMARLGESQSERLAAINDPLENDLWQGLELLYGDGEFDDRNKAYTEYMATLYKKYPSNQEIAAFYALGLIWSSDEYGDGNPDLMKSASIADGILAENPLHPGALHYKIHALDGPVSASEAQTAADRYAKVAPDAAHALHMPSHIYLALGRWDDVVNSNTASYQASVDRMNAKGLEDGARGYHSYSWLHYGMLQQGRFEEAESLLQDMLTYVPRDPTKGSRVYLLGMQNRQLVEAGSLLLEATSLDPDVKIDDLGLQSATMRSFLRTQLAFKEQDAESIGDEVVWLTDQINVASTLVGDDGKAMCSAGTTRYAPNEDQLVKARVILHQMKAMIAHLDGDIAQFENHLKTATGLEAESDFPTGPPRVTLPSFEQYGSWLLSEKKYGLALKQFETSLKRTPRRSRSLMGKMEALKGLGKVDEAQQVQSELEQIWKDADESAKDLIASI